MKPLEPPDLYHLRAAVGWLELGKHLEANEELEKITARLRAHPDALKVRWRIYAKAERWDACLEIARAVTDMEPDKPGGWIDYAQSLHRFNRTQEAHDLLASVVDRFPDQTTIFYHLAVYGYYYEHHMALSPYTRTVAIDGVEPTVETIASGKYPYETKVYAAYRDNEPAEGPAMKLLEWILSSEGQAIVRESGYVPVR